MGSSVQRKRRRSYRNTKKRLTLHEQHFNDGIRVDREAGVIRDVKVIGYESANGYTYTPKSVEAALPLELVEPQSLEFASVQQ